MYAIETHDLTKRYGGFTAVSGLEMHVRQGSVYGFLGPNGAGKSTTMKMMLGLVKPSSGAVRINGLTYPDDRMKILRSVGSFIEQPAFYANLTGEENLDILRRILGLPKSSVAAALETVGLSQFAGRRAGKYSLGMKQRLGLAGALLGEPPVLLLDEPTNGLDPVGIHEIRLAHPLAAGALRLHGAGLLPPAERSGAHGRRRGHSQRRTPAVRGPA